MDLLGLPGDPRIGFIRPNLNLYDLKLGDIPTNKKKKMLGILCNSRFACDVYSLGLYVWSLLVVAVLFVVLPWHIWHLAAYYKDRHSYTSLPIRLLPVTLLKKSVAIDGRPISHTSIPSRYRGGAGYKWHVPSHFHSVFSTELEIGLVSAFVPLHIHHLYVKIRLDLTSHIF